MWLNNGDVTWVHNIYLPLHMKPASFIRLLTEISFINLSGLSWNVIHLNLETYFLKTDKLFFNTPRDEVIGKVDYMIEKMPGIKKKITKKITKSVKKSSSVATK